MSMLFNLIKNVFFNRPIPGETNTITIILPSSAQAPLPMGDAGHPAEAGQFLGTGVDHRQAGRLDEDEATSRPSYPWQQLDADLHFHSLKHDYAPVGLLELVAPGPREVLDVGCFCGGSGQWLKKRFPGVRLTGIEMLDKAANVAREKYDTVILSKFEDVDTSGWHGKFDAIIAADVLEHLYNPWAALERLKPLLAPGGAIYISLPNIRNLNILMGLAGGEWRYAGAGILDITHIRFFTKAQALEMLKQTGWIVSEIRFNPDPSLYQNFKDKDLDQINCIKAGRITLEDLKPEDVIGLFALQFFIRATPLDHS